MHVAVIARPGSTTLGQCLASLRAAGVETPVVVTIGPEGAGQARNAALEACTDEVLALVEDDVAVEPSWLRALEEAWAAAGEDVAVVAGPLLAPPPLGHDASARTFHGGNVSFRAPALRGAGGFWPARGGARDWLSDEHHAQEALLTAGWRTSFTEGAAAKRLAPGPVQGARWRYGRRLAAMGGRSRGVALREAVRAGAALLRGPSAARAGRVAENLGALIPAPRDFEPAARSTPFRPSVPAPARKRSRPQPGALILLYHRVAELESDPLGLAVTPAHFAQQMEVLGDRVIPLEQLAAERAPGTVAITFDDGYHDNVAALATLGLPVTLFVSTGHVEHGRAFWWDELERLPPGPLRVAVAGAERAWRDRQAAREALQRELQALDAGEIAAVLSQLGAQAPPAHRPMTVEELKTLHAAGVAIGAHTRTHRGLAYAPDAAQREEIEGSRDDLTRWLGSPPRAFSYPFGVPGADVDATAMRLAREARYTLAVVNAPRPVRAADDRFALPRRATPDVDGATFRAWL